MTKHLRFQAGGTLNPKKHIYIERDADDILFELLKKGEYANILTSRQMGKSSLMMRTVHRLDALGVRWSAVDLAAELGSPRDIDSYYLGLLGKIARDLKLDLDLQPWWEAQKGKTNNQRLLSFFRDVVGGAISGPVVIFLDEIDSTLKLAYTDDLFTALRGMYNERGVVEAYGRVSFCLLGVATPNELIKERRTTAYNVGETRELRDFNESDDLRALSAALSPDPELAAKLLERVLYWTGGHPYLTQKLCADILARKIDGPDALDRLVETAFSNLDQASNEVHFQQILRFLNERLTEEATSLKLYARLLDNEPVRDQTTLAHAELKLSGLVKRGANGHLRIRNPIYERLFNKVWLESMPSRRAAANQRRIVRGLSAALAIVLVIGSYFVVDAWRYRAAKQVLVEMGITISDEQGTGLALRFPARAENKFLEDAIDSMSLLSGEIRSLSLPSTQVSDIGVLKGLSQLQTLYLPSTQVSDIGALKGLSQLQTLDLSGAPVSETDRAALKAALPETRIEFEFPRP
jgi:hypothetical protein